MTQDSPGAINSTAHGASVIQVETLGRGGVIILWLTSFIAGLSIVLSIFAWSVADKAEREARLMQYEYTLLRPALRELGVSLEDQETHEEEP